MAMMKRAAARSKRAARVIARYGPFQVLFQKRAYTPVAAMLVTTQHKSTLEKDDIAAILRLARDLPQRVFWYSGPWGGCNPTHAHVQLHRREELGDVLQSKQCRP